MKTSTPFALGLAISLIGLSAAAATEAPAAHPVYRHHSARHRTSAARNAAAVGSAAQSAPSAARPEVPPAVQNDSDGLSLDPENCNMGCVGNTQ